MKLELELAAEEFTKYGMAQPKTDTDAVFALKSQRRVIREQTEALINRALLANDFIELANEVAGLALVAAGTAVRFGQPPTIKDFVLSAKDSVEDARAQLDRALMIRDWEGVRVGLARLEIIWRGVCACLSVPYEALLRERHRSIMEGTPIDKDRIRAILTEAGIKLPPPPASNDGGEKVVALRPAPGSICAACGGNVPCGNPDHPGNEQ